MEKTSFLVQFRVNSSDHQKLAEAANNSGFDGVSAYAKALVLDSIASPPSDFDTLFIEIKSAVDSLPKDTEFVLRELIPNIWFNYKLTTRALVGKYFYTGTENGDIPAKFQYFDKFRTAKYIR